MLNVLSTPTFDPDGYVELQVRNTTTPGETRRRVNRIATLDGGVVINDFGYAEADRTLQIAWPASSRATEQAVDRLVQLHDRVQVSTRAGVFLAAPESYTPGAEESTLRLLVIEKLSA
jgi:hypothetical protein